MAGPSYTLSAAGELVALSQGATTYPMHSTGDPFAFQLQSSATTIGPGPLRPVPLSAAPGAKGLFSGTSGALTLTAGWGLSDDKTALRLRVSVKAKTATQCTQLRLVTGVDMAMVKYPDYNAKMMPGGTIAGGESLGPGPGCGTTATMLSPDGKALLWASPQPLDSFQVLFDGVYGGHRVNTLAFDLINAVDPRPAGFTRTPPALAAGQTRTWDFFVVPLPTRTPAGSAGAAYEQQLNDAFGAAVVRLLRKPAAVWTGWAGVASRELVVYASEPVDGMAGNANLAFKPGDARQLPSAAGGGAAVSATTYEVTLKVAAALPLPPLTLTLFNKAAGIDAAAVVGSAVFPWANWSWCKRLDHHIHQNLRSLFSCAQKSKRAGWTDANLASSFVAKWVQPKCGNSCEQYMSAFALATAQRFGGRSASRQPLLEGFVDADLM
eukprot:COSAG04_NODE_4483_length_2063_cov_1.197556_2_plen_437_part_00